MADSQAKAQWDSANTTRIVMKLNNHTDAEILAKLAAVESKQGYIKQLIRADIAKSEKQAARCPLHLNFTRW
jgi:acyl carrier protein